jgi:hypothetical protein
MSRRPSEKTQLAAARREVTRLTDDLRLWQGECRKYRTRSTQAEQELAEWKVRFDKLLEFRHAIGAAPGKTESPK